MPRREISDSPYGTYRKFIKFSIRLILKELQGVTRLVCNSTTGYEPCSAIS